MTRSLAKAVFLLLATSSAAYAVAVEETPIGRQVQDFVLPDFHGQTHSLADYRDRIVVLAFLGTECPVGQKLRRQVANASQRIRRSKRRVPRHRRQLARLAHRDGRLCARL